MIIAGHDRDVVVDPGQRGVVIDAAPLGGCIRGARDDGLGDQLVLRVELPAEPLHEISQQRGIGGVDRLEIDVNSIVVTVEDQIRNPLRGCLPLARRRHRIMEIIPARDIRDHRDDLGARLPHDRQGGRIGEVFDRLVGVQVVEVGHHSIEMPDDDAQGREGGIAVGDIIGPPQMRRSGPGRFPRRKRQDGDDNCRQQRQMKL